MPNRAYLMQVNSLEGMSTAFSYSRAPYGILIPCSGANLNIKITNKSTPPPKKSKHHGSKDQVKDTCF